MMIFPFIRLNQILLDGSDDSFSIGIAFRIIMTGKYPFDS